MNHRNFSQFNQQRLRVVNQKPILTDRRYVLYWMQAYRRLDRNHSLDYAISLSQELKKELVIYEGLRMDYPWNSERLHRFIMEGMCDNFKKAKASGFNYWCFVETPANQARDLLKQISENACIVITDDFPTFIIPKQIESLSKQISCKLVAVDGNCLIPLGLYPELPSAARILRYKVHQFFPESYIHSANKQISKKNLFPVEEKTVCPFVPFSSQKKDIPVWLGSIPFQNSVPSVKGVVGGSVEAKKILQEFLTNRLEFYVEQRSNPNPPLKTMVSHLSPFLHFGFISAEEIIEEVLNYQENFVWAPDRLNMTARGKRENFFSDKPYKNAFLDELIVWRDIGYLMFWKKKELKKGIEVLPNWAKENFQRHKSDKREYLYGQEELETYQTHDPIWNSAQKELVKTGRMHNYMRMLWGKKILEWTPTIEVAFSIAEELNNKYAFDGRNPNSYTGILWCLGMFDRPWFPERNVYGTVRYMSSDSTTKKFKLKEYLEYVNGL
jgi:deoxyribodipyrimidine photo-lyase